MKDKLLTLGVVLMISGMLVMDKLPITAGTLIIIGEIIMVIGAKKGGWWIE